MIAAPPTLAKLKPNPQWARLPLFDRKGWRTMAFGEFAESVNERVEPSTAAEAIYVGLDDLDSGSLHIRRWGKGSDVIGTKLRFRKGDSIFGRRRAYQRKLAVADMDGICSAHAMVVRARPGVVLPEFLPFLMMSDRFMSRAVEISVGSLSPTINWTTLKHEPFTLPPLDQQRRLAEILWAVDEARTTGQQTETALLALREAEISDFRNRSRVSVLCSELLTLASGKAKPKDIREESGGGASIPVYGGNGIIGYTAAELLTEPTVVVGRVGEYCGCVHFAAGSSWITDNAIFVKAHDERLSLPFLYWMLRAADLNKKKKIAGQPLISQSTIAEEVIPVPSAKEQARFLERVDQLSTAAAASATHSKSSSALLASIINSLSYP
jgi:restriction endonuclease S subunit